MSVEEDTPDYWNELALELFEELKPEVDWMVDTLTKGGRPPGEVKPTMALLTKMPVPQAMQLLGRGMAQPQTARETVHLFAQYLQHLETQSLDAGSTGGVEQVAA